MRLRRLRQRVQVKAFIAGRFKSEYIRERSSFIAVRRVKVVHESL